MSEYGKPFVEDIPISFSISHSGDCVVTILSTDTLKVGIDIEELREIDIHDFENVWNQEEWKEILKGDLKLFYKYWTRKEAIVKANGGGCLFP